MSQKTRAVTATVLTVLIIASIVVTVIYIDPTPSVTNVQLLDDNEEATLPTPDDNEEATLPTPDDNEEATLPTPDDIEYSGKNNFQDPIMQSFNSLFTDSVCEFYKDTHVFVPEYIDCIVDDTMIVHEVKDGYTSFPLRSESIDLYAGIMDGDCIDYIDTIQCN